MTTLALYILLTTLADSSNDALRLRIDPVDGPARDVRLTEIRSDNRLYFADHDAIESFLIDDLSRIIPAAQESRTAQPSPGRRTLWLAAGGRLVGEFLDPENASARTIRVDIGLPAPLNIPLDALAAVRFSPEPIADAQGQLEARLTDRPADKDLLLVAQGEKTVILPGALDRLTPIGWEFTVGKKTQKRELEAAYAVVLGGANARLPRSAVVQLIGGSQLTGRIASADSHDLRLDSGAIGTISIPWPRITSIALSSDRIVYLSDLRPTTFQTKSALDLDFPPRMDSAVEGRPMSLRGRHFDKGIGVHANTSITYKLDGQFEKFLVEAGIDDTVSPNGSVVFRVLGDGRKLHESATLHGDDAPVRISVDVSGISVLTLECTDAGDLDISDHADWADARLIRAKSSTIR